MNATSIGDSRYDDRLDDSTSPGFREKAFGIERAFLDRVRGIDAAKLSPASRITYDIFVSEREQALEGQKFHEEYMPFNQMPGLPMDLAVYGSGTGPQPFVTAKDYDRFLKRMRQFPRWADGAIALMRAGISSGITLPRVAMAKVVRSCAKSSRRHSRTTFSGRPSPRCPRRSPPRIEAHQRRLRSGAHPGSVAGVHAARGLPRARLSTGGAHHRGVERPARRPGLVSLAHPPGDHHGHARGRNSPARSRGSRAHSRRDACRQRAGGLQGRSRRILQVPRRTTRSSTSTAKTNCSTPIATSSGASMRCCRSCSPIFRRRTTRFARWRRSAPPPPRALRTSRRRPTASARESSTSTPTTSRRSRASGSKRCRCTRHRPDITSRSRFSRSSPTCRASAASTALVGSPAIAETASQREGAGSEQA